jgi:hypothetical protein
VSNEARHRDIAALLARGVVRVKKQPLVAKSIESHMASVNAYPAGQLSQDGSLKADAQSPSQVHSVATIQHGGDR